MHQNDKPLFESLESRQLFAATPAASLPDFTATLNYSPGTYVAPGSTLSGSVKITNIGAAMAKKASVPVSLYVSPTPTLAANATPFKTIRTPLTLAANGTSSVALTNATLPKNITAGKFYVIAKVNNGNAVKESNTKNNTSSATPALTNPLGHYAGTFVTNVNEHGTFSLNVTPGTDSSKKPALFASASIHSPLADISFDSFRITIDPTTGATLLNAHGSYRSPSRGGMMTYLVSLTGTLSNKTLTGTLNFSWRTSSNSYNATSTFTATKP